MRWFAAFACALVLPAWGQQPWPAKPVRLIISNPPGDAPDLVARALTEQLSKAFGRQWFVENRPGGESIIGAEAAAHSAPDGYTFYFASQITMAINPNAFKTLPYDPDRDFTPVAMVIDSGPFVVAVNPEVAAKNLPELIQLARQRPGALSYSATVPLLAMFGQWLNKHSGIDMVEVQYKTPGQAVQDVVTGRVQVIIIALAAIDPFVKSGKLRVLAVTSGSRLKNAPDVPTVGETFPGFEMGGWLALVAPKGLPSEIAQRVNREVDTVVHSPEFEKRVQVFGWSNGSGARNAQAIGEFIRVERARWRDLIQEIGLQPK